MRIGAPSRPGEPLDPDRLTVGEATMHRRHVSAQTCATGSGALRLSYFTARKSEPVTQMRLVSGTTAAGATPTLVRAGVYSVATNGDLALLASIANDPTVFAAAMTAYTRSLIASFQKVAGTRYAVGLIVVTAAAAPTVLGNPFHVSSELGQAPRLCAAWGGQTDLPASVPSASAGDTTVQQYSVLLP